MKENILKKYYIMGHDNMDIDSFISCYFLYKLLNFKGIDSEIVIMDKEIDKATYDFMFSRGFDLNSYKKDTSYIDGKSVVLVDHHETTHNVNVVACIDHHTTDNGYNYSYYLNKKSGSCARLIYEIMLSEGYIPSKEDKILAIYSVIVDTSGLRNTKYREDDKSFIEKIMKDIKLSFTMDLDKMVKEGTFLTDLSQGEKSVCKNGYKSYSFKNDESSISIKSSYIEVMDLSLDDMIKYVNYIRKNELDENTDLWIFIVYDFKDNCTYVFRIKDKEGHMEVTNRILSRGVDIISKIEKDYL